MTIGEKLLELRKKKSLSQEEVADKLNVTRQTISKWETDQSTPDFDKIAPICELYDISADELLRDKKIGKEEIETERIEEQDEELNNYRIRKKAKGIGISIFLYFISVVWIMVAIPVQKMNAIVASAGFLIICGIATAIIVYTSIVYKSKKERLEKKDEEPVLLKQVKVIISTIILIIYLTVSFLTMAWHITWILWIVYALIEKVLELIFMLKGEENEK